MNVVISIVDFCSYMSSKLRLGESTITTRKSRIKIFLQWWNKTPITGQTIEQFFTFLQEKGLSNTSLNTYHSSLLSFEKYIIDRGFGESFMIGFRKFPEDEPFIDPLSDSEIERLIQTKTKNRNDQVYQDLTAFISYTGCRLSEALSLRFEYVDLTEGKVVFVHTKSRKNRTVYFVKPIYEVLKRRIGKGLVFTNSKGGEIYQSDYGYNLKERARLAGIIKAVHPHILRHSYATASHDDTGDLLLVKEIMGHKDINSTMRYIHMSGKRVKEGQVNHPFNQKYIDPAVKIKKAIELLESLHLEEDPRFDLLKVKEAKDKFTTELYKCFA